jgi:hypothetical protein
MSEPDILANLFTKPDSHLFDMDTEIEMSGNAENSTIVIRMSGSKAETLTPDQKAQALLLAEQRLEESRISFIDLQTSFEELDTAFVLSMGMDAFNKYAMAFTRFMRVVDVIKKEEYVRTEMCDYMDLNMAKIMVNSFLTHLYERYIREQ